MSELEGATTGLNYVDFIVLGIAGISLLIGLVRGFTREFFGALAWTGAVIITFWGKHYLNAPMRHFITNPFLADLSTIVIVFVTCLFVLLSITKSLSLRIKASVLGGLDRSLGAVFGAARGIVICVVGFLLVNTLWKPHKRPAAIQQARSYPFLLQSTKLIASLLPPNVIPPAFYHPRPILNETGESILPSLDASTPEVLMKVLAKPKTSSSPEQSSSGYPEERRRDMDRLFKNYGD
jgi:membrane protein required for colicin V production